MYTYNIFQWIGFFALYCMIGWVGESLYVSAEHRKWVNRGFLKGPFLPIYGFGAIVMLFATMPVRDNLLLTFLFGMAGATILEYFTGYVMEKLFHVKYWDYTCQPLNLNGYICMGCSIAWGVCSILLTRLIHKPVERFLLKADDTALVVVDVIFLVYFIWDVITSAKEAFNFRKIIDEKIQSSEELRRLQKRLDVLIAVVDDDIERIQDRIEDGRAEFRNKIADGKAEVQNRIDEWKDKKAENKAEHEAEIEHIKIKMHEARERYNANLDKYKKHAAGILKRNPNAVSRRHVDDFEELKEQLRKYLRR